MKRFTHFACMGIIFLSACQTTPTGGKQDPQSVIAAESKKANAFFEEAFQESLARSPMYQSYLGIKDNQDLWDDVSDEKAAEDLKITKRQLADMKSTINKDLLDDQSLISYNLFVKNAEDEISFYKWRYHSYPINQMHGWQSQIPSFLINIHRISDKKDAEDYISRLNGIGQLVPQIIENLKKRKTLGMVAPRFVFPHVISDSENVINGAPFEESEEDSTLLTDFKRKVNALDIQQSEKDALIKRARTALIEQVAPAYTSLINILRSLEKTATTEDGGGSFPMAKPFIMRHSEKPQPLI